jgi:hypothetical protein
MAVTVLDCAYTVKAIYKNQDIQDFRLLTGFYDAKNSAVGLEGYSVGVYQYLHAPSTCVLSCRGSAKGVLTKDWIDDDVSIGLGRSPDRTNDSINYALAKQAAFGPGALIIVTGHSLGGHIAQVIGVFCNMPFCTFNAPPARGLFTGKLPGGMRVGNFNSGINYRVNYDPVSKVSGKHVGPLVTLPLNGQAHGKAHGAATVIASVIASGFGNRSVMAEIQRLNP